MQEVDAITPPQALPGLHAASTGVAEQIVAPGITVDLIDAGITSDLIAPGITVHDVIIGPAPHHVVATTAAGAVGPGAAIDIVAISAAVKAVVVAATEQPVGAGTTRQAILAVIDQAVEGQPEHALGHEARWHELLLQRLRLEVGWQEEFLLQYFPAREAELLLRQVFETTPEHVAAGIASELVVAQRAHEHVVIAAAGEGVIAVFAEQ